MGSQPWVPRTPPARDCPALVGVVTSYCGLPACPPRSCIYLMTSEGESSFTCLLAIYIIGELFLRYILFRPLDSKLQVFLLWWQLIYSIGFAFPFFFTSLR